jgi:membrane protein
MAVSPKQTQRVMPDGWAPWLARAWRTAGEMIGRLREYDSILTAAGCAFYATLSLIPAITMLISLYGLAFNPRTVEPQLALLRGMLQPDAETLIVRQVQALLSHHPQNLGLSLGLSALFIWWSASSATTSIMSG